MNKFHHEHWPTSLFYLPVYLYFGFNAIRLRRLNYPAFVNPRIPTGGLCGFSKRDVLNLFPEKLIAQTVFLEEDSNEAYIKTLIKENKLSFPIIAKPDRGERGFEVSKCDSFEELASKVSFRKTPFLLQEFIPGPLELGLFLVQRKSFWEITSIVSKDFLSVEGDGVSTIGDLIKKSLRAEKYFDSSQVNLDLVPSDKEEVLLEPIGNHCRGTKFVNENSKISKELEAIINQELSAVQGVRYCRLDLRTESWGEFGKGNFKILEVNGVSAEPGHIYDPNVKLSTAYKDLLSHWKMMADIAMEEIELGNESETLEETLALVKAHRKMKKIVGGKI